MESAELAEARGQRDSLKRRIQLMRDSKMKTRQLSPREIDTTDMSLQQAEQSLAALERKIARLENSNA